MENCWSLEPIKHSWSCLSYPSCSSQWFYAKICNNTWGSSVQAVSTHRLRWDFCPFKALHSWVWKLFYFPLCCPVRYLEFQLAYTWTRPATPISAWQALEWSTIPKMMGILGPQSESYVTDFFWASSRYMQTCYLHETVNNPEIKIKAANSPSAKQVAKKWKMWYVATKSKP